MKNSLYLLAFCCLSAGCRNGEGGESVGGGSASTAVPDIPYTVLAAHPHDTAAFTQGLELWKGILYESTGLMGRSSLRKTDLKSGKVTMMKALDSPYFAEGITIRNDTLYQLTWQNHEIRVCRAGDLSLIRKAEWSAEGWGITHDDVHLYISDGSDRIYVVRPSDLKLERVISVSDPNGPVNNLNELEFVNGKIYANRWQYDYILRIDPSSGMVTGRLDMTDLLKKHSTANTAYMTLPGSLAEQNGAVLNGIAYDTATGRLLVTGKLWPHVFEIKAEL